MLLTAILISIVVVALALLFFTVAIVGATTLFVFGDVIVCVVLICWLIKKLRKRNKKEWS